MIPMGILGHCSGREEDVDNNRTKRVLRMIQQPNVLKIMQQLNKNTESEHVFIEHLVLRLYLSTTDLNECDIRFPKKDRMKKTLTHLSCHSHPSSFATLQHLSTLLFLRS